MVDGNVGEHALHDTARTDCLLLIYSILCLLYWCIAPFLRSLSPLTVHHKLCIPSYDQIAAIATQLWRHLVNAYELKVGMVHLQHKT